MPPHTQGKRRQQWINAINSHQNTKIDQHKLHICQRHFEESCFIPNRKKRELTKLAIPTIFDSFEIIECTESTNNNSLKFENNNVPDFIELECVVDESPEKEIDSLKNELNRQRLQYDIEKKSWENKKKILNDKCKGNVDKIHNLKSLLKEEINVRKGLEKSLIQLRQHYCPDEPDDGRENNSEVD